MTNNENFPVHIFPDIDNENKEFPKYKKKNISEDYISENFKRKGWTVYRPYVDTGLDLIITKEIKDNKTNRIINITRFIQVKTRTLVKSNKNGSPYFGYTLKTKDFRDDPRGVIIFYNDNPDFNGKCDVFVIPMYNFFKYFYNNSEYNNKNNNTFGESQFSLPSFRQENGKINSLHYDIDNNEWKFKNDSSFSQFLNERGYNMIDSTNIESNFVKYKNEINIMKQRLYYHERTTNLSKIKLNNIKKIYSCSNEEANKIYFNKKNLLYSNMKNESNQSRKDRFKNIHEYVKNNVNKKELLSSQKYRETQRNDD